LPIFVVSASFVAPLTFVMLTKSSDVSLQFEPFNNVFGCNLNVQQDVISFNGTLFRLPLRTKKQAATSEISNIPYDQEQMSSLIKIFVEAGGNFLLDKQHWLMAVNL
jgi:sacsin